MVTVKNVQQTIFTLLDSGTVTPTQVLAMAQARNMQEGFDNSMPHAIMAAVSAWSEKEMDKTRRQMALYGL